MKRNFIFGIIILTIVLIIAGYTFYLKEKTATSSQEQFYKISSLVEYNSSLCNGIGYAGKRNGFNSGMKFILKDKITGELLQGYATMLTKEGIVGSGLSSGNYSCEEGIDSENVLVSAYAKGYPPLVFNFKYPKNRLATVEVSMIKSCSGGPGYFDNLKLAAEMIDNQTLVNGFIKESQDILYGTIKNQFGLEKADYNLQCIEMNTGRGGYIKAKGAYRDGSPLELYYHWGWCSSSGFDCGWSMCFSSTNNSLFESVKSNYCNNISSYQSHGGPICTLEAYDNTQEVRDKCNAGEFEKITEGKKTLSIIQDSNRCKTSVTVGEFNCLELTDS